MTKSRGNQKIKIEVIEAVLELLDKLEPKPKPKPHQDEKLALKQQSDKKQRSTYNSMR